MGGGGGYGTRSRIQKLCEDGNQTLILGAGFFLYHDRFLFSVAELGRTHCFGSYFSVGSMLT